MDIDTLSQKLVDVFMSTPEAKEALAKEADNKTDSEIDEGLLDNLPSYDDTPKPPRLRVVKSEPEPEPEPEPPSLRINRPEPEPKVLDKPQSFLRPERAKFDDDEDDEYEEKKYKLKYVIMGGLNKKPDEKSIIVSAKSEDEAMAEFERLTTPQRGVNQKGEPIEFTELPEKSDRLGGKLSKPDWKTKHGATLMEPPILVDDDDDYDNEKFVDDEERSFDDDRYFGGGDDDEGWFEESSFSKRLNEFKLRLKEQKVKSQ